MRWYKEDPKLGDSRLIMKFLFIPKCINKEWRWLEVVIIKQKYLAGLIPSLCTGAWIDIAWID